MQRSKRSAFIGLCCTPAQKRELRETADRLGYPLSRWLVRLGLDEIARLKRAEQQTRASA